MVPRAKDNGKLGRKFTRFSYNFFLNSWIAEAILPVHCRTIPCCFTDTEADAELPGLVDDLHICSFVSTIDVGIVMDLYRRFESSKRGEFPAQSHWPWKMDLPEITYDQIRLSVLA